MYILYRVPTAFMRPMTTPSHISTSNRMSTFVSYGCALRLLAEGVKVGSKRIPVAQAHIALAQPDVRDLRRHGFHAMTLFEVIFVCAAWFSAPAEREVGDERHPWIGKESGEQIPTNRTVDLRHSGVNDGEQILVPDMGEGADGGGNGIHPHRSV